jgi:hypothetical protein
VALPRILFSEKFLVNSKIGARDDREIDIEPRGCAEVRIWGLGLFFFWFCLIL